jgi:hypothetical protein
VQEQNWKLLSLNWTPSSLVCTRLLDSAGLVAGNCRGAVGVGCQQVIPLKHSVGIRSSHHQDRAHAQTEACLIDSPSDLRNYSTSDSSFRTLLNQSVLVSPKIMLDLRLSQQRLWRVVYYGICRWHYITEDRIIQFKTCLHPVWKHWRIISVKQSYLL